MESIEALIPDNEGNHLVVVLYFYDVEDKSLTFEIPPEFVEIDVADINIRKLNIDKPLGLRSFLVMSNWLIEQLMLYPNAVFSFICSLDDLKKRHVEMTPGRYRWELFEKLCLRYKSRLENLGINSQEIVVGPEGYQSYAKVFYRDKHSAVIHLVVSHLAEKY